MALEQELDTYRKKRDELLPYAGRYVLIHGDQVAGVWDSYEDALRVGYDKFGLNPFFIRKIETVESVHYSTREIPCRS
jgi:hypothetical protein